MSIYYPLPNLPPEGKEYHVKPFPLALLRRSGYAKARGETGKGVI
jgi:hypothetical protein